MTLQWTEGSHTTGCQGAQSRPEPDGAGPHLICDRQTWLACQTRCSLSTWFLDVQQGL